MKENKLISEINRVKQLGGYNVSLTLNEQSTGSNNFACMGGIIPGPGACQGPGNYTMGNANVQAVFSTMADCQNSGCGGTTGGGTTGCANITYDASCPGNPGGANYTQNNDGCSTIDGNMPTQAHVGTYIDRGTPNVYKVLSIGAQNTTNNGNAYTSVGCTGGPTPGPGTGTTTGTTGGGIPTCMGMTSQGCPGTPQAYNTMITPTSKCATIDNIPVTASDVGRDIIAPMGGQHMTVQSVFPNPNGNGSDNVTSAQGPCPRPNTSTGTTGGPTPPPPSPCNKTCQQLAPTFKKLVRKNMSKRNNPKRWLKNRIETLKNKLTKAKGSCNKKRLKCKLGVLEANLNR